MKTVIDERVVEMRFNNEDFEKNVAQSMATLEDLKKSLNFDSAKSLEDLGKASKSFSLSGITTAVAEATTKFSALEIAGVTAIMRITNAAIDMGSKLVKDLSIDQVMAGFDKYATKTQSIQTIIAATGENIGFVTEQIGKLNWFTDETSYSLTDMTNNIAKFTSNGIKLANAVTQMIGIANAAALAGAGVESASHAMDGFSKAMAAGKMTLQNWKWIQTAKMDTVQFKQSLIDAAVAAGTLTKVTDGYFETLEGNEVSVSNFTESLKDGWMTAKVMSSALETYGDFSVKLNDSINILTDANDELDITTSELLDFIDQYKKGTLNVNDTALELGVSAELLDGLLKDLSDDALSLGNKAFRAGQEAKTFQEAIDSVKDAVSTGWMNTFELIFGNYEQAKKLWTGLANTMWDVFAAGGARRNDTLELWSERNALIEAFVNVLNMVIKPLNAVKEAWYSMFPPGREERAATLDKITRSFRDLTSHLVPTQKVLTAVYSTFKMFFTIGKAVGQVIGAIVKAIIPAAQPFGSLLEMIATGATYVSTFVTVMIEYASKMGVFGKVTTVVSTVLGVVVKALKTVSTVVIGGAVVAIKTLITVFNTVVSKIKGFVRTSKTIQTVINSITTGIDKIKKALFKTNEPVEQIVEGTVLLDRKLSGATQSAQKFNTTIKNTSTQAAKSYTALEKLQMFVQKVAAAFKVAGATIGAGLVVVGTKIVDFIQNFRTRFAELSNDSSSLIGKAKAAFKVLGELFGGLKEKIEGMFKSKGFDASSFKEQLKTVSESIKDLVGNLTVGKIAAIVLGVALLSLVGSIVSISTQLKTFAEAATGVLSSVNKMIKKQFMKSTMISSTITDIAKAFTLMAAALAMLTFVDQDALENVFKKMMALTGAFAAFAVTLTVLAGVIKNPIFTVNMGAISASVVGIAGSVAVLALALVALNAVKIDDTTLEKVVALIALLTAVTFSATLLTGLNPLLPKTAVSIILLSIALSQLVKSLKALNGINFPDINGSLDAIFAIFSGLALVTLAASRMKITGAVAIIVLAKYVDAVVPAIQKLANDIGLLDLIGKVGQALANLNAVDKLMIGVFAFIMAATSFANAAFAKPRVIVKVLDGVGGVIAGIGISMLLISYSIKTLKEVLEGMPVSDMAKIFGTLLGIIVVISTFFVALAVLDKTKLVIPDALAAKFASMAVLVVAIGASIYIMSMAVEKLASIENLNENFSAVTKILAGMTLLLAGLIYASSFVKKALPACTVLIAATAAIGILVAELATMSIMITANNWKDFVPAIAAMGLVIAALIGVMRSAGKITTKASLVPVIAFTLDLAVIGASLYFLTTLNTAQLLSSAVAMAGIMGMLALLMQQTTKMSTGKVRAMILVTFALDIVAVGAALAMVAQFNWVQILSALAAVGLVFAELVGATTILAKFTKPTDMLNIALSMTIISGAMVIVAGAIKMLEGISFEAVDNFVGAVIAIGATVGILGVLSSTFPGFKDALLMVSAAFVVASSAFVVIAYAFNVFASSLPILAAGFALLTPELVKLSEVDLYAIAGQLTVFGLACSGLGLMIGFIAIGAAAIRIFAGALGKLGDTLKEGIVDNFDAIITGFDDVGIAVIDAADSVEQNAPRVGGAIRQMMLDSARAFNGEEAKLAIKAANEFGKLMGGDKTSETGLIGGFAEVLGWHSPPQIFFGPNGAMSDMQGGFEHHQAVVQAAEQAGADIGTGFGSKLLEAIQPALDWIKNTFGEVLGKLGIEFEMPQWLKDIGNMVTEPIKQAKQAIEDATNVDFGGADSSDFMSDVEEQTNKLKEDLEGVTSGFEGMGDAAGKGGKKAKEAVDSVKKSIEDAMDIFSEFKSKTEMSGDQLLNNIRTNFIGISTWTTKLAVLAERGISETLYNKLAEMGPKSIEQVNAFINMTSDELKEANRLYTQSLTFSEGQTAKIAANYAEATKRAKAAMEKEMKDSKAAEQAAEKMGIKIAEAVEKPIEDSADEVAKSAAELGEGAVEAVADVLEDTDEIESAAEDLGETVVESFEDGLKKASIEDGALQFKAKVADLVKSQLDIFEEFDAKTELTAKKMLENMESNIKGVASWSAKLAELAKRGISQGLLEQLGELGPKGYEKVNAFVKMTDEELKKANELFAQSLTLPQTQSNIAADSFRYAAEMAVLGFSDALANEDAVKQVGDAVKGITDEVKAVLTGELDIHSPSRVTEGYATNTIDGYRIGIINGYERIALVMKTLGNIIKANFNAPALTSYFYNAGKNATLGFASGIGDSEAIARVIAESRNVASTAINTVTHTLDERSPSHILRTIGSLGTKGFAIGISDGAENVANAAKEVAENAIDGMSSVAGRIQDVVNTDMDLNPIITPMLDLTLIKSQIESLNAMFGSGAISVGLAGQNGGSQVVQPQQINNNYTQILNSPKALDRLTIYRESKNLFAQTKGAVYNHA